MSTKKYWSLEIIERSCLIDWTEECLLQSKMLSRWYLINCLCAKKFSNYGFLTCPCALVTNCPVAPCRFDKVFPNTWDPAMDPMAAAAATWLASGFSCWGSEIINQTHNRKNTKQKPHTPPLIATGGQNRLTAARSVQSSGNGSAVYHSAPSGLCSKTQWGKAIEGWEEWCKQKGRYGKVAILPL